MPRRPARRMASWRFGFSRSLSLSGRVLDEDGKPSAEPSFTFTAT